MSSQNPVQFDFHDCRYWFVQTDEFRAEAISTYITTRSDLSSEIKSALHNGIVVLGMNPFEAHISGKSHMYAVKADPKKWPQGAVPPVVIASQCLEPDESEITLFFRNNRQFPDCGEIPFSVSFIKGKAVEIQVNERKVQ